VVPKYEHTLQIDPHGVLCAVDSASITIKCTKLNNSSPVPGYTVSIVAGSPEQAAMWARRMSRIVQPPAAIATPESQPREFPPPAKHYGKGDGGGGSRSSVGSHLQRHPHAPATGSRSGGGGGRGGGRAPTPLAGRTPPTSRPPPAGGLHSGMFNTSQSTTTWSKTSTGATPLLSPLHETAHNLTTFAYRPGSGSGGSGSGSSGAVGLGYRSVMSPHMKDVAPVRFGFANMGNTCYLGATLALLTGVPDVLRTLLDPHLFLDQPQRMEVLVSLLWGDVTPPAELPFLPTFRRAGTGLVSIPLGADVAGGPPISDESQLPPPGMSDPAAAAAIRATNTMLAAYGLGGQLGVPVPLLQLTPIAGFVPPPLPLWPTMSSSPSGGVGDRAGDNEVEVVGEDAGGAQAGRGSSGRDGAKAAGAASARELSPDGERSRLGHLYALISCPDPLISRPDTIFGLRHIPAAAAAAQGGAPSPKSVVFQLFKMAASKLSTQMVDRDLLASFKGMMGKRDDAFLGNDQQDAHQFLTAVLDVWEEEWLRVAPTIATGHAAWAADGLNVFAVHAALARVHSRLVAAGPAILSLPTQLQAIREDVALLARSHATAKHTAHRITGPGRLASFSVRVTLRCRNPRCGFQRTRLERFHDLSIDLPPPMDVDAAAVGQRDGERMTILVDDNATWHEGTEVAGTGAGGDEFLFPELARDEERDLQERRDLETALAASRAEATWLEAEAAPAAKRPKRTSTPSPAPITTAGSEADADADTIPPALDDGIDTQRMEGEAALGELLVPAHDGEEVDAPLEAAQAGDDEGGPADDANPDNPTDDADVPAFDATTYQAPTAEGAAPAFSLEGMLRYFFRTQALEYRCDRPGCSCTTALVSYQIEQVPNVLFLHLKRFEVDMTRTPPLCYKRRDRVVVPPTLSLASVCGQEYGTVPLDPRPSALYTHTIKHAAAMLNRTSAVAASSPAPSPAAASSRGTGLQTVGSQSLRDARAGMADIIGSPAVRAHVHPAARAPVGSQSSRLNAVAMAGSHVSRKATEDPTDAIADHTDDESAEDGTDLSAPHYSHPSSTSTHFHAARASLPHAPIHTTPLTGRPRVTGPPPLSASATSAASASPDKLAAADREWSEVMEEQKPVYTPPRAVQLPSASTGAATTSTTTAVMTAAKAKPGKQAGGISGNLSSIVGGSGGRGGGGSRAGGYGTGDVARSGWVEGHGVPRLAATGSDNLRADSDAFRHATGHRDAISSCSAVGEGVEDHSPHSRHVSPSLATSHVVATVPSSSSSCFAGPVDDGMGAAVARLRDGHVGGMGRLLGSGRHGAKPGTGPTSTPAPVPLARTTTSSTSSVVVVDDDDEGPAPAAKPPPPPASPVKDASDDMGLDTQALDGMPSPPTFTTAADQPAVGKKRKRRGGGGGRNGGGADATEANSAAAARAPSGDSAATESGTAAGAAAAPRDAEAEGEAAEVWDLTTLAGVWDAVLSCAQHLQVEPPALGTRWRLPGPAGDADGRAPTLPAATPLYELHGILRHEGRQAFRGHYMTDLRDVPTPVDGSAGSSGARPVTESAWYRYDDSAVSRRTWADVSDVAAQEAAYVVVYVRKPVAVA